MMREKYDSEDNNNTEVYVKQKRLFKEKVHRQGLLLSRMKISHHTALHPSWPELHIRCGLSQNRTGETRDNNNKCGLVFLGSDYNAPFTV